jgi:hypothetical protein
MAVHKPGAAAAVPFRRDVAFAVDGLSAFFLLVVAWSPPPPRCTGRRTWRAREGPAGPGACPQRVCRLHGPGVLRGRCPHLPAGLGGHDAGQLRPGRERYAQNEENTRAGLLYLVMAHAGTAALLVVFLTLAERGQAFDFVALRAAARSLPAPRAPRCSCSPWPASAPRRGGAAARLAAQGASRGAQPRVGAHVGGDAQGGAVRDLPFRL